MTGRFAASPTSLGVIPVCTPAAHAGKTSALPAPLVLRQVEKFQDGCTDYYQWNIYGHKVAPNMSTVDFYDTNALQTERG